MCRLYRRGHRITPDQLASFEHLVIGILNTDLGRDEKVRRWGLNALAQIGRETVCLEAIIGILERHTDDPQTAASAIAAIYKVAQRPDEVLRKIKCFDPQMVTLAALQHADPRTLDLQHLPVKIDHASCDSLKLALVVVGLNRAPPHLFDPRHDNPEIVRVLGGHDDHIVSQYSVWAITENPQLGLRDLGVDLKTIENRPANVRSWMFQLIGMSAEDAIKNMEYVHLGRRERDPVARLGLALGLRETYFDGIEDVVVDWVASEEDLEIRLSLLEHLVRHSGRCETYQSWATELYKAGAVGSVTRLRMMASAVNTPLNVVFRRIEYGGDGFFEGAQFIMGDQFNIHGGVQGGAVSLKGNADNKGAVSNHYSPQTVAAIQSQISGLIGALNKATIDENIKTEAIAAAREAQADPTPEKVNKLWGIMNKVATVAELAAAAAGIAHYAGLL